jgi:ectoine hydroxylase-related dioxygenase (phytanoyl-CoA dioxygenase family)
MMMSIATVKKLSAEQHRQYREDGAIRLRGVVDPDVAARLLHEVKTVPQGEASRADMDLAYRLPSYWDCVTPVLEIAAELTGSKTLHFYNDHLFSKEPGVSKPTPWHQDLPYWPFKGDQIIAPWIALTPVRWDTSPLQYVRGSHRRGQFYRPTTAVVHPNHPDFMALPVVPDYFDTAEREGEEFLSWELEAGDVLCHHPLTVHGAYANESRTAERAGLTVRLLGEDVTWSPPAYLRDMPRVPDLEYGQPLGDDSTFPIIWTEADGPRIRG